LRTDVSRRRERGFTLIEVVVAFVLLALVLVTAFEVFATGMSRAGDLDDRSRALAVAQSRLAAAGTEELFREGQTQGDSEDRRFRWTTLVTRSEEGQDPARAVQAPFILFRVDVRVEWRTGAGRDQDLVLSSLGIGQRPQ
jgi:general secretion pathway protein I